MKEEMLPSEIIARKMMKEIQYDNGAVDINNPESYPLKWVVDIRMVVMRVILSNPGFKFTDQVIEDICCGEEGETQAKYGYLGDYDKLSKVLNEYFNEM